MIHVHVAVHLRENKVLEAFTQSLRVFISRETRHTRMHTLYYTYLEIHFLPEIINLIHFNTLLVTNTFIQVFDTRQPVARFVCVSSRITVFSSPPKFLVDCFI